MVRRDTPELAAAALTERDGHRMLIVADHAVLEHETTETVLDELVETSGPTLRQLVTDAAWESEAAAKDLAEGFLTFFRQHGDLLLQAPGIES